MTAEYFELMLYTENGWDIIAITLEAEWCRVLGALVRAMSGQEAVCLRQSGEPL